MSNHHLPSDPADWPNDPHQLLGVTEIVETRELRRAYNRLIRVYKPESHPQEFQRIREAYEALLQQAEWQQQYAKWDAEDGEERNSVDLVEVDAGDLLDERQATFDPAAESRDSWQLAQAGRQTDAYRDLVNLHGRAANVDDVLLRLYWLLKLFPSLDSSRVPADWLAVGLVRHGLSGPLLPLYLREVESSPAEATSERCRTILEVPSDPHRRRELYLKRWAVAAGQQQWTTIEQDLANERAQLSLDDTENWARLLFAALDYLGWSRDNAAADQIFNSCLAELGDVEHLSFVLEQEFHQLDILQSLTYSGSIPVADFAPAEWSVIIRRSWNADDGGLRRLVREMLSTWVNDPIKTLKRMDYLKKYSEAAVERMGQVVRQMGPSYYDYGFDENQSALRRHIRQWLVANLSDDYGAWRQSVLVFCLTEVIPLDAVYEAAFDDQADRINIPDEVIQALYSDSPLRCVIDGCNAFVS